MTVTGALSSFRELGEMSPHKRLASLRAKQAMEGGSAEGGNPSCTSTFTSPTGPTRREASVTPVTFPGRRLSDFLKALGPSAYGSQSLASDET
jgi:hypothetical protein